jgi:hypothetical protein
MTKGFHMVVTGLGLILTAGLTASGRPLDDHRLPPDSAPSGNTRRVPPGAARQAAQAQGAMTRLATAPKEEVNEPDPRDLAQRLGNWAIKVPDLANGGSNAGSARDSRTNVAPQPHPVRLIARSPLARPDFRGIGTIESIGAVTVDGQAHHGRGLVFGSEQLRVPAAGSARVSLAGVGQVALIGQAAARLAASVIGPNGDGARPVLIATLTDGEVVVKLQPQAGAYVQAGGLALTAFNGATFRLRVYAGQVTVASPGVSNWALTPSQPLTDLLSRSARQEPPPGQRRYRVEPVGLIANISVRTRSTRQIQVRVTDENDRPVPDLPIIFTLGSRGPSRVGVFGAGRSADLSATVTTNAQGVATAPFSAGDQPGLALVTATVAGTNFSWAGEITVYPAAAPGFWTWQHALPVFATAAAGVAAGVVTVTKRDDPQPVGDSTPIVIRP